MLHTCSHKKLVKPKSVSSYISGLGQLLHRLLSKTTIVNLTHFCKVGREEIIPNLSANSVQMLAHTSQHSI
jgi:hypothetical protein